MSLLTYRDVMERLNCSRSTAYRLMASELLAFSISSGKGRRVDSADLESWIAAQRQAEIERREQTQLITDIQEAGQRRRQRAG